MNRFILVALIGLSSQALPAQNKISRDGQIYLDRYRNNRLELLTTMGLDSSAELKIGVIAMLAPGYTADDITAAGYTVLTDMHVSVIVEMPVSSVEEFAALPCVQSLTFGGSKTQKLDLARSSTRVDAAHKGIEINDATRAFTGNGVIVGLMDNGLEAHHLNFLDSDGKSRIQRLWYYYGLTSADVKTYSPSNISSFTYDTKDNTHATHVAGILTGCYKGNGDYAYTTGPTTAGGLIKRKDMALPYYGVATGATPVFAVGKLEDDNILGGVERIINYAQSVGKPAVINLSLGTNVGPHDGTDEFTASLNELGKDAIICVSSGNEAEMDMSLTANFTDDNTTVSTFIIPASEFGESSINNMIDIWSSDNRPFTVTLATYRITDGSTTNIVASSGAGSKSFTTKTGMTSGQGSIVAGVNTTNNRYNVYVLPSKALAVSSSYRLMIKIKGKAGQKINMYYGGYGHFKSMGVKGFTDGSADESISGMATAPNLLAIGSYSTRQVFGVLGDNYAYSMSDNTPGQVSTFSSYGTMPDGTRMPIVLAPGSTIISSYNRYYVEGVSGQLYGEDAAHMTGSAKNGSDTDYWGAMDGTSMSCPFAAGVIALWLEADPSLDVDGIKDVIAHSSVNDSFTQAKPAAAGYGKINAEAGLRYILTGNAAIGTVVDDPTSRMLVSQHDGSIDVVMGGEAAFTATLFDLQGRPVTSTQGHDASATLTTSGLAAGMYVLTVNSSTTTISRKIVIR